MTILTEPESLFTFQSRKYDFFHKIPLIGSKDDLRFQKDVIIISLAIRDIEMAFNRNM